MKINKILAAGIAATLAVTSLSAVVSAEEKTREFDMTQSIGAWDNLAVAYKSVYGSQTAGDIAYATETDRAVINFSVAGIATLYKYNNEYILKIERNTAGNGTNFISGTVTQYAWTKDKGVNFDSASSPVKTLPTALNDQSKWEKLWSFNLSDSWWSGAEVTATGYKYDGDGKKVKVSQTATAYNDADIKPAITNNWDGYFGPSRYRLVVLPDDVLTYKAGTAIAPAYFDEIEDVEVKFTLHNKVLNKTSWQYTDDETEFNKMKMLLEKIRIPISDAYVTYTDVDGKLIPGADVDATKDGTELYTNKRADNKALVDGQMAKVTVTYGQTNVEKAITDNIAWINDDPSVARDMTADPKVEGTDVLSVDKYKQVSAINVMAEAENAAGAKVESADAAGYVTEATGAVCKTADGKYITLYKVLDGSHSGNITADGKHWASVKSTIPYASGDAVYVYEVDAVLPVYQATSNPTTWSGYKQVRANAVSDQLDVDEYVILANGSYSTPTKKMNKLAAEVAIYDIAGSVKGGNTAAAVLAYCIAHGGYDPAVLINYVEGVNGTLTTYNNTKFAYLQRTTSDATIGRKKVALLSKTGDYASKNGGDLGSNDEYNQSYNTTPDGWNKGTHALQFAGLASQVADFFNKQNNGKIVFHFTNPTSASSSWVNGGVPSTEVGLKNALDATSMAIFFNYEATTGSLQSNGVVDSEAYTMTFDIAEVLDTMGNLTASTLHDIYYGMNKGLRYADYPEADYDVGYLVDKVILSYDDAAAAVDATADDDAAVVVADDDDDDDVFADDDVIADDDDDDDDDDDAGIIEDDDDDDTDVNNDVDYVDGDDDANPGTGVGLAVIPAIVAAAAAIVSKKRK